MKFWKLKWLKRLVSILIGFFLPLTAFALTISPSLFSFTLQPGEQVNGAVEIQNDSEEMESYRPLVQDFTATDETGSPQFFVEDQRSTSSLAPWLSFDARRIELLPGENRSFPFTITVPSDAEAGGYYSGLLFSSVSGPDGTSGVETRVGPLIVVGITGNEAAEDLGLVDFNVSRFQTHLPVRFNTRLRNSGLLPARPTGTITITNALGATVAVLPFNSGGGHVLSEMTRQFENGWQKRELAADGFELIRELRNFALGYFKAHLSISTGENETLTDSITFWVMPWQIIFLLLVLIALLILWRRRVF